MGDEIDKEQLESVVFLFWMWGDSAFNALLFLYLFIFIMIWLIFEWKPISSLYTAYFSQCWTIFLLFLPKNMWDSIIFKEWFHMSVVCYLCWSMETCGACKRYSNKENMLLLTSFWQCSWCYLSKITAFSVVVMVELGHLLMQRYFSRSENGGVGFLWL